MPNQLISAVMITGHQPERHALACCMIDSFFHQVYQPMELVILNAGKRLPILHSRVRQIHFSQEGKSLGEVRQAAHDYCSGDWILWWDDDDWSHWGRAALQAQALGINSSEPAGDCCLLKSQVRYSFPLDIAVEWRWPSGNVVPGVPGTMLYRKSKATIPFRNITNNEDTHFILDNFAQDRVVVVENTPELFFRFHHGHNLSTADHIMGPLGIAQNRGGRFCTPEAQKDLQDLLEGPLEPLKAILTPR